MSNKTYFFEGLILGAIAAVVSMLFLSSSSQTKTEEGLSDDQEVSPSVENLINQTRDAIEKGFDKLSDMMNTPKKGA